MAPGYQRNWGGVNSPWKILGQQGSSCIVTHVLYKWKYHTQKPPSYESCLCCTILQFFMWYVYWVKHPSDGLETKKCSEKTPECGSTAGQCQVPERGQEDLMELRKVKREKKIKKVSLIFNKCTIIVPPTSKKSPIKWWKNWGISVPALEITLEVVPGNYSQGLKVCTTNGIPLITYILSYIYIFRNLYQSHKIRLFIGIWVIWVGSLSPSSTGSKHRRLHLRGTNHLALAPHFLPTWNAISGFQITQMNPTCIPQIGPECTKSVGNHKSSSNLQCFFLYPSK